MYFTFTYFGNKFTSVTIDTNGYVVFSSSTSCCSLTRPSLSNSIPALNFDLTTTLSTNGGIYYKYLNSSSSEIVSIQSIISPLFKATNAFSIEWNNVTALKTTSSVSFKIILATDTSSNYVVLQYSSCLSGTYTPLSTPGLNYINQNGVLVQVAIVNPCSSSNVNIPGTWVFYVTDAGEIF